MKKKYTKKQIEESIKYWEKQLKKLDESAITSRPVDFGGRINLYDSLYQLMNLDPEFRLQIRYNANYKDSKSNLTPIDNELFPSYDEMKEKSDVSIAVITDNEYLDDDFSMIEKQLKYALTKMFGTGFDVKSDEYFMVPYKDKLDRTWYIAFINFIG